MSCKDDDNEKQLSLEFLMVPQCHNCAHWWPNLHHYRVRTGSGTCDLDGMRTDGHDSCGFHCEDVVDTNDWYFQNGKDDEGSC